MNIIEYLTGVKTVTNEHKSLHIDEDQFHLYCLHDKAYIYKGGYTYEVASDEINQTRVLKCNMFVPSTDGGYFRFSWSILTRFRGEPVMYEHVAKEYVEGVLGLCNSEHLWITDVYIAQKNIHSDTVWADKINSSDKLFSSSKCRELKPEQLTVDRQKSKFIITPR